MLEVFKVFLALGLTSFGGPVAHLGYFRREFVERRRWLTAEDYASLLAMCQFLPGPASSQAGFCIGLMRAGWPGGLAAWAGFTLPSALIMAAIARFAGPAGLLHALLHGLQLAAVAVVAQAVWAMAGSLCPDTRRRLLALSALVALVVFPGTGGQVLVLAGAALLGRWLLTPPVLVAQPDRPSPVSPAAGAACLAAFAALLVLAFLPQHGLAGLAAAFYRSGALVFGGGHVVLPLLKDAVVTPGWVSPPNFLAGYGAAQAMPGPLFTVAAYLGTAAAGTRGAIAATLGIFLPGLLIAAGALPFWHTIRTRPGLAAALMGVNAAVVGLLAYAWLTLLRTGALHSLWDIPVILLATTALLTARAKPLTVVAFCAVAGLIV